MMVVLGEVKDGSEEEKYTARQEAARARKCRTSVTAFPYQLLVAQKTEHSAWSY